jgi:hypothetical protein
VGGSSTETLMNGHADNNSQLVSRYVAMCDVLGFSHLVETNALELVRDGYAEIVGEALRSSRLTSQTILPDGSVKESSMLTVGTAVFSDTLIAWSLPNPSSDLTLVSSYFFSFVGQLILGGLRRTRGGLRFPIRAGIAYGPVCIVPESQIYIGKPIIDAYRTEQAQEWIGAACHPSCRAAPDFYSVLPEDPDADRFVSEYPVPLHEGRAALISGIADSPLLPVVWPGMIHTLPTGPDDYYRNTVEDLVRAERARSGESSRETRKWENTLAFGMRFRAFRDPEDKEPF